MILPFQPEGMELFVNIANLVSDSTPETVIRGAPRVLASGKSLPSQVVVFDGRKDQLVIPGNPLFKARNFTVEALFFPFAGGSGEQRFVHLQKDQEADRILLETRLSEDRRFWYGDTFLGTQSDEVFLNDPAKIHPTGQWATMALRFADGLMQQWVNGGLELSAEAAYNPWANGKISLGQRINRVSPFAGALACLRFSDFAQPPEALWKPEDFALPAIFE